MAVRFSRKSFKLWTVSFFVLTNFFIFYVVWAETPGKLKVYFLDVGQGDAIFIKSPNGNKMLVDGGAGKSQVWSELSKAMPFYDHKIDIILATHPDQDHIGGFSQILGRFDVDYVIENGGSSQTRAFTDFQYAISEENSEKILARRGMKINLGAGAIFVVLFPDREVLGIDSNDGSIVGKLVFGQSSFLLTGDSPLKIEEYLVGLDSQNLESDVLKAGHHGSKTSTSENFVTTVNPKYTIISAGKDNRYGHPHEEVLGILKKQKTEVFKTSESGTILFESDGRSLKFE